MMFPVKKVSLSEIVFFILDILHCSLEVCSSLYVVDGQGDRTIRLAVSCELVSPMSGKVCCRNGMRLSVSGMHKK